MRSAPGSSFSLPVPLWDPGLYTALNDAFGWEPAAVRALVRHQAYVETDGRLHLFPHYEGEHAEESEISGLLPAPRFLDAPHESRWYLARSGRRAVASRFPDLERFVTTSVPGCPNVLTAELPTPASLCYLRLHRACAHFESNTPYEDRLWCEEQRAQLQVLFEQYLRALGTDDPAILLERDDLQRPLEPPRVFSCDQPRMLTDVRFVDRESLLLVFRGGFVHVGVDGQLRGAHVNTSTVRRVTPTGHVLTFDFGQWHVFDLSAEMWTTGRSLADELRAGTFGDAVPWRVRRESACTPDGQFYVDEVGENTEGLFRAADDFLQLELPPMGEPAEDPDVPLLLRTRGGRTIRGVQFIHRVGDEVGWVERRRVPLGALVVTDGRCVRFHDASVFENGRPILNLGSPQILGAFAHDASRLVVVSHDTVSVIDLERLECEATLPLGRLRRYLPGAGGV